MKSRQDLIRQADKVFSRYVRTRGENSEYNECFTCNRTFPWAGMDAGHFMSRRYLNTRWHPVNVWPQCKECNQIKHGRVDVFEAKLRARFGNEAIDELIFLAHSLDKVTEADIANVIKTYKSP